MIILLDAENKYVSLYKETNKIPFSEIEDIQDFIIEKDIYVTNAIEVNSKDIINLVYNIEGKKTSPYIEDPTNQQLYLHTTTEGTLQVNENLKFGGKYDLKPVDEEIEKLMEQLIIKQLIKSKKLEIVNEREKRKLLKESKIKLQEEMRKEKLKDARLDTILINKPVDIYMEEEKDNVNDIVSIDMTDIKENKTEETEIEKNLRIINRNK